MTDEILEVGCLADRYLSTVYESVYSKPPLTLTHNDIQGENLFISDDERPSVVMIDWQLTTPAWGALDLASSLACHLEPNHRRSSEKQLIETYHSALTARGIGGYSLERCQQDYRTLCLSRPLGLPRPWVGILASKPPQVRSGTEYSLASLRR